MKKSRRSLIAGTVALVSCVGLLVLSLRSGGGTQMPGVPKLTDGTGRTLRPAEIRERQAFFEQTLLPYMGTYEQANREAAERAAIRIREAVDGYRAGIPAFVADLTSLTTRGGILVRWPGDLYYDDDRIQNYVQSKFERHLFTEQQFAGAIETVVWTFVSELEANRQELMVATSDAMAGSDIQVLKDLDYETFTNLVLASVDSKISEHGRDSVVNELLTLFISGVGVKGVKTVGARVGISIGTKLLTSVGASASRVIAFGLVSAPFTKGISLVIALLIDFGIDMWMTDQFRDRLTADLNEYMTTMSSRILDGTGEGDGLRDGFQEAAATVSEEHQRAVRAFLLGAE